MFEIEYKGANSVIISSKNGKLIVDPKLSLVGLKDIPTKGAIELATEKRFLSNDPDSTISIEGPGEYGVSDFDIKGIPARRHIDSPDSPKESTIYRVMIGESRIGIIGNIYEKLSDDQLEKLGVLDVLIIPVGGNGYTLDATGASSLVRAIGPSVVIPVHYADKSIKYEVPQGTLDTFVSEMGAPVERLNKYKSKQLASEQSPLRVIELTRS